MHLVTVHFSLLHNPGARCILDALRVGLTRTEQNLSLQVLICTRGMMTARLAEYGFSDTYILGRGFRDTYILAGCSLAGCGNFWKLY